MKLDSLTWIDLAGLATTQSLPLRWNILARRIELGHGNRSVAWTEGVRWAGSSDYAQKIEAAPRLAQGTWWTPLRSTLSLVSDASGVKLAWDSTSQTLLQAGKRDLIGFKLSPHKNTEVAELRLAKKTSYESAFHPPWFVLRFKGVQGDSTLFSAVQPSKLVKKISTIQDGETFQVGLQLIDGIDDADVTELDSGLVVQVTLQRPDAASSSSTTLSAAQPSKRKIRTIVIDPGHGGKDPGAVGKDVLEKDIALTVGLKLQDKLRKAGFIAKMTRDDDTFVELQDRPALAAKFGGDLFVSLLCNAVEGEERRKKTDGFRVYILREAESEEDKAIARRENKAAELSAKKSKSEISPVEWILLENQLNQFTKQSEILAMDLVENIEGGQIRKMGSGAGQAGFMVLVGAFMPAVLVELGFITNPEDEKVLQSRKGEDELADRIMKAIVKYRDSNGSEQ